MSKMPQRVDFDLWQKKEYIGMKPGLDRITNFLKEVRNPHLKFKTIHIAGTNGKGSTARMIASVLEEAGCKTGLYTSPHLVKLNERIQVNSRQIYNSDLYSLASKYFLKAQKHHLTFFEFITVLCFIYFALKKIDIAVLESGLGGRFDATNIIKSPLMTIITDIDYDHQQILGNTLKKIAFEKAGIIKYGCPVISGVENLSARNEIARVSKKNHSEMYEYNKDFFSESESVDWKKGFQKIYYQGFDFSSKVKLSLLGEYQIKNCALAIAAVERLNKDGFKITKDNIKKGLSKVRWPGRFQVIKQYKGSIQRTIILDGAHNPGGMDKFLAAFKNSSWGNSKRTFVFGMLQDKNFFDIIKKLAPFVSNAVLVPINSARQGDINILAEEWKKYLNADKIKIAPSLKSVLNDFDNNKDVIVVTGSLYLVGEALKVLN